MPERRRDAPNDNDDAQMASTAEVKAVVQTVQRSHRGRIKWGIGRHTAELALRALDDPPRRRPMSSKSRRRKRHKRLL